MWKGEEVCIDKIRFRMKELSVVHGLNESARRGLMEDLLLVEGGRPVKKPIAPVGFGRLRQQIRIRAPRRQGGSVLHYALDLCHALLDPPGRQQRRACETP